MKLEQAEQERLRKENAKLSIECDLLKKRRSTSSRSRCEVRLRCETPRDVAIGNDVRGARCFATEPWLYAVAMLGLYSRRIVGWSMQESMTSQLMVDALMMAVWRRGKPMVLRHHSDQSVHHRALPRTAQGTRHHLQHEPSGRCLGQLGHGDLLQLTEDRAHRQEGVSDA